MSSDKMVLSSDKTIQIITLCYVYASILHVVKKYQANDLCAMEAETEKNSTNADRCLFNKLRKSNKQT